MTDQKKDLRDFLFRGLMFESEAAAFQAAGIQVGADSAQAEERLLSEALAPFGVFRRNQALEMARLYAVLHCEVPVEFRLPSSRAYAAFAC